MKHLLVALAVLLGLSASPALAQQTVVLVGKQSNGSTVPVAVTPGGALTVTGGGGGGGGDASAANQSLQITQETLINTRLGDITSPAVGSAIYRLGQIVTALSAPLAVTQSGAWNVGNITGTVSLPTGAATATNQTTLNGLVDGLEAGIGAPADAVACSGSGSAIALLKCVAVAAADTTTPVPVTKSGTWDITSTTISAQLPATLGSKSNALALATVDPKSATPTGSTVAASASSVTVLAANSARIGCTIINDSTANAWVNFGATASSTAFVAEMLGSATFPHASLTCPADYTGQITMIWASATGNARVNERTP
jgi:hypothetical protein